MCHFLCLHVRAQMKCPDPYRPRKGSFWEFALGLAMGGKSLPGFPRLFWAESPSLIFCDIYGREMSGRHEGM